MFTERAGLLASWVGKLVSAASCSCVPLSSTLSAFNCTLYIGLALHLAAGCGRGSKKGSARHAHTAPTLLMIVACTPSLAAAVRALAALPPPWTCVHAPAATRHAATQPTTEVHTITTVQCLQRMARHPQHAHSLHCAGCGAAWPWVQAVPDPTAVCWCCLGVARRGVI